MRCIVDDMKTNTEPQLPLEEAEAELAGDLALLESWPDRYEYIIELGRSLPPYPDEWHTEDREVFGCQSQVWLNADYEQGRLWFQADSNALITKGLVAMLVGLYSGRTLPEIQGASLNFLQGLGLASHLTPSRVNGLHAMFKRIQQHAADAAVKEKLS